MGPGDASPFSAWPYRHGHGDHAVSHDFLHRHRSGSLAVARKCVNDFTFGNETKNCLPACHHESADVLYAQPVRRSPNAGIRLYCCDVGALLPQNGFNGHSCISSVACLDLVAFGGDGGILICVIVEMGPVRSAKTMVRAFAVDAECAHISALLVNDV